MLHRREIFCKAGILERWRNGATLSRRRGKLAILTNGSLQDGGQGCQGGEVGEIICKSWEDIQQGFLEMFSKSFLQFSEMDNVDVLLAIKQGLCSIKNEHGKKMTNRSTASSTRQPIRAKHFCVSWKILSRQVCVPAPSSILQPPLLHSQKTFVLPACQTCPSTFALFFNLPF